MRRRHCYGDTRFPNPEAPDPVNNGNPRHRPLLHGFRNDLSQLGLNHAVIRLVLEMGDLPLALRVIADRPQKQHDCAALWSADEVEQHGGVDRVGGYRHQHRGFLL